MNTVYVSRAGNIYLGVVNHSFYASFLGVDRFHRYLPVSTKRTSKKILYREMARAIFVDTFKRILPDACFSGSCVSHGRNESVMLVNNDPRIHFVGVDIEFIENAKAPRPFMLDYCEKNAVIPAGIIPDNRLCITIFSCMESLYKALCAISPCTFDINDYVLIEHNREKCAFRYVGKVLECNGRVFLCNCYYLYQSVITIFLLDGCFKSIVLDDLLYKNITVPVDG